METHIDSNHIQELLPLSMCTVPAIIADPIENPELFLCIVLILYFSSSATLGGIDYSCFDFGLL